MKRHNAWSHEAELIRAPSLGLRVGKKEGSRQDPGGRHQCNFHCYLFWGFRWDDPSSQSTQPPDYYRQGEELPSETSGFWIHSNPIVWTQWVVIGIAARVLLLALWTSLQPSFLVWKGSASTYFCQGLLWRMNEGVQLSSRWASARRNSHRCGEPAPGSPRRSGRSACSASGWATPHATRP